MKEWRGNKNSVQAQLGIKSNYTTEDREQDDFYATDPKALELLLDHCSTFLNVILESCKKYSFFGPTLYIDGHISLFNIIWECAVGNGNLYNLLKEREYCVIGSDIKDRGFENYKDLLNKDFLEQTQEFTRKYDVAVILTNPPYSLANEFITHALDILPENGLYIAFMNLTYLAGQKRYLDIYRYGHLREVYVFPKRMDVYKNNVPGKVRAGMVNYAWFVFQKGYVGNCSLYWLYE